MKVCAWLCLALIVLLTACKKKLGPIPPSDCASYDALWIRLCEGHTAERCILTKPEDIAEVEAALNHFMKPNSTAIAAAKLVRKKSSASAEEVRQYRSALNLICVHAQYRLFTALTSAVPKERTTNILKQFLDRSYNDFPSFGLAKSDLDLLKLASDKLVIKFHDFKAYEEMIEMVNHGKLRATAITNQRMNKVDEFNVLKAELETAEKIRVELRNWLSKHSTKFQAGPAF